MVLLPDNNDNANCVAAAATAAVAAQVEERRFPVQLEEQEESPTALQVNDKENIKCNDNDNDGGGDDDKCGDNGEKDEEGEEEETFTSGRDSLRVLETYKRKRAYGSSTAHEEILTSISRKIGVEKEKDSNSNSETLQHPRQSDNDDNNKEGGKVKHGHLSESIFDLDGDASSVATVACEINEDLFQMDDEIFNFDISDDGNGDDDGQYSTMLEKMAMEDDDNDNDNKNGNDNDNNSEGKNEGDGNGDDDEIVHDCTQKSRDEEEVSGASGDRSPSGPQTRNDDDENMDDMGYLPDNDDEGHYVSRRGRNKKKVTTTTKLANEEKVKSTEEESPKVESEDKEESFSQTQGEQDQEEENCDDGQTENEENDTTEHAELSKRDLRKEIRSLFSECEDKDTITVKQFRKQLEKKLQRQLNDSQKGLLKEQLIFLMNAEESSEDEGTRVDESDYEENKASEQKNIVRAKKRGKDINGSLEDSEDEDENKTNESPVMRSKTRPRKPRKPSHLKIHHEMRRKKLLAEAKIRAEELQAAKEEQLNEEDRKRAALIAKKFDTNTDEARIQRIEDRVGLLGKLKQKRLDLLAVHNQDSEDEDVKVGTLSKDTDSNDHNLTIDILRSEKDEVLEENQNEESDEESEDDDSNDELEIIGTNFMPKMKVHIPDGKNKRETNRKKSPTSVLEIFGMTSTSSKVNSVRKEKKNAVASLSNPRAALRNALRAKQFESGNRWLAK